MILPIFFTTVSGIVVFGWTVTLIDVVVVLSWLSYVLFWVVLTLIRLYTERVDQEKFVAFVNFRTDNSKVKFSCISEKFKTWFYGKIEKVKDATIPQSYHDLRQEASDNEIITNLGNKIQVETTLVGIYKLMRNQRKGEEGILLVDGFANIFYIRDISGVLRAVSLSWCRYGWAVVASQTDYPIRWNVGSRVFFLDS
ncbi:MAG: hypothetical protein COU29_02455 [Candidatus Magasanikbacteria bacterium CG10_big_fil_rev_8_21_14_0_10_36_32]|uniref:Uncharacterized protein n=1 Tax=Candidatus Magasanikbacteria bacterium CG10_big_fil_rev_8_21_14_0_10_36_32 TaxID=1974646 RepID=A0A2M6W728_9BACT|nr:MAG: hypothetical protein COU29_02455 [Candidatus Magasanikbacteria bacterium CG10_big_fil_rev_8_21_14_0_10_36_32]